MQLARNRRSPSRGVHESPDSSAIEGRLCTSCNPDVPWCSSPRPPSRPASDSVSPPPHRRRTARSPSPTPCPDGSATPPRARSRRSRRPRRPSGCTSHPTAGPTPSTRPSPRLGPLLGAVPAVPHHRPVRREVRAHPGAGRPGQRLPLRRGPRGHRRRGAPPLRRGQWDDEPARISLRRPARHVHPRRPDGDRPELRGRRPDRHRRHRPHRDGAGHHVLHEVGQPHLSR